MRVLLTNDDGVTAPGLQLLGAVFRRRGHTVWVVAPDRERSSSAHAVTVHTPIAVRSVAEDEWQVGGTPADAVKVGLYLLHPCTPDVVVSGINAGTNLARRVIYSGTVAAAVEAALQGIPALAASCQGTPTEAGAECIAQLAEALRAAGWLPRGYLLNVNLPAGPMRGLKVTRLGRVTYRPTVRLEPTDVGEWQAFVDAGTAEEEEDDPQVDIAAVNEGYGSVTPLTLDWTADELLPDLEIACARWRLFSKEGEG